MSKTVSAASATVPRSRSTTSNEPARRRPANTRAASGARARKAALRELLAAARLRAECATKTRSEPWAIAYLAAGRPTSVLAQPRVDPADAVKLVYLQADRLVAIIRAVLTGLDLSDADFKRGIAIAQQELRAASRDGWEPL
jgi:hypothetical protein